MKKWNLIPIIFLSLLVTFNRCEKVKVYNNKYALVTTSIIAIRKDASVLIKCNIFNPDWLDIYKPNDSTEYINPDYYEVYLSKNTDNNWQMVRTVDYMNAINSFIIEGLKNDVPYYVYLKAISSKIKDSKKTNIAMFIPSSYKPTYSFVMKDYYGHDLYAFDINRENNVIVYATKYYEYKPNYAAPAIFISESNNAPKLVDIDGWFPDYNKTGTKITYSSNKGEIFNGKILPEHIVIYDVFSKKITKKTYGNYVNKYPAWSPDNKLIAFSSSENSDQSLRIKVLNPETNKSKILQTESNVSQDVIRYSQEDPVWSPDGKYIYYTRIYFTNDNLNPGYYDIYRIKSEGGKPESVFTFDGVDCSPSISPDNLKIAFLSELNGKLQLWVYYFQDNKYYQVLDTDIYYFMKEWSQIRWKNNNTILFTAYSDEIDGDTSIFSVSIK